MRNNRICLILEGTYPYLTGGVSTWVQKLISGLPEFYFDLVHIFTGKMPEHPKYDFPENLQRVVRLPLTVDAEHSNLEITLSYVPEADVYHSLSTGFAGLVGMNLKKQRQKPFLLTEHGIYWHEIEMGVDEIECGFKIIRTDQGNMILGQSWETWLDTFKNMARKNYQVADKIVTVCRHNQKMQQQLGAKAEKCLVIHNGVSLPGNTKLHRTSLNGGIHFGLVGRVTAIKDIQTFIKACTLVRKDLPHARFWVIGPTDHDPAYYRECLNLKDELKLAELTFTGEINSGEYYHWLDIVVLTSRSEAQPYVLLEAMAAGIPVIATDVGGCRDLILGNQDDLGAAGEVCRAEDPMDIARAMLKLVTDNPIKNMMAGIGKNRVKKFYSDEKMITDYRKLYKSLLGK